MTAASIIIPSRGGARRLRRLLSALAAQTTDDWEAIVVIDGDIDGSEDVVNSYAHLPVRPIVLPENRGRVAALNAGHEAARGEILIRCDDDLEPYPDYVSNHLASHAHSARGTVGLYLNVLPPNRYSTVYGYRANQLSHVAATTAPAHETWKLWAGNVSIDRDTWVRVGPYDPRYRAYGWEDIDYGYRLHTCGIPVIVEPRLATPHHVAATSTRTRVQRAFHSGEARHLFDDVHGTGASGAISPGTSTIWGRAVDRTARHLTYGRALHLASAVDTLIRFVPTPVARKMVALPVEAASVAGYHSSSPPVADI